MIQRDAPLATKHDGVILIGASLPVRGVGYGLRAAFRAVFPR
jgi:hypothetical protein